MNRAVPLVFLLSASLIAPCQSMGIAVGTLPTAEHASVPQSSNFSNGQPALSMATTPRSDVGCYALAESANPASAQIDLVRPFTAPCVDLNGHPIPVARNFLAMSHPGARPIPTQWPKATIAQIPNRWPNAKIPLIAGKATSSDLIDGSAR